jgi:nicotinate-nucleotide pyrophosphorylase (carboxylating)
MIKDNHLVDADLTAVVTAALEAWPGRTVQVECDSIAQVAEASKAGADALLLDNMTPDEVVLAVAEAEANSSGRRPLLEVSGGVTLETVGSYASTGADLISSGALTNSAPVLDIGLDLAQVGR